MLRKILLVVLAVVGLYLLILTLTAVVPFLSYRPLKVTSQEPQWVETDDRVVLVDDIEEAWLARLDMLERADHSIDIAFFAFHGGESVTTYLSYLLAATDKGVKVRLLLDGMAHGLHEHREFVKMTEYHPNFQIAYYNPINLLRPHHLHNRMHEKVTIIDGRLSMVGGRNVGDKYFTNQDIPNVSVDRDLIVYQDNSDGLMLRELESYYQTLWDYDYTWQRPRKPEEDRPAPFEKVYQKYHHRHKDYSATAPNRAAEVDWRRRSFPINRAYYVHNSLHPRFKEPRVWKNMVNLMDQAEERIMIQTPYVVPAQEMIDQWQAAVDPEVEMTLLTNSMNSANNIPGYAATANHRQALIDSPMHYFEYQPVEAQMHMKLFVIDETISAVGTFNLDQRSANLNAESMLVIDSPEFTRHLLDEMDERYMADSWEITRDNQDYKQQTIGRQILYHMLPPIMKWIEPMI